MEEKALPNEEKEKKRYAEHNNNYEDAGYKKFLNRVIVPLVDRLSVWEKEIENENELSVNQNEKEEKIEIKKSESNGEQGETKMNTLVQRKLRGLDFGCGPQPVLSMILADIGYHVDNYDLFFNPNESALVKQYDFVTATEVVEHFHNPIKDFGTLCELVKPGGYLAIMTSFLDEKAEKQFENWYYRRDPTHVLFYKASTFHFHFVKRMGWKMEVPAQNVVLLRKPKL
jgi:2-polyprenyl-3-methyl-5-hydroxy-6-metoxy-1,4-benzoquinol methylase